MSGRDFNQPKYPRYTCVARNCGQQVYKYSDEPYPLYCYDCQKKSDNETKATKPKNNKFTKYEKSL